MKMMIKRNKTHIYAIVGIFIVFPIFDYFLEENGVSGETLLDIFTVSLGLVYGAFLERQRIKDEDDE